MFSNRNSRVARPAGWVIAFLCAFGLYKVLHASFVLLESKPPTGPADRLFQYPWWAAAHFVSAGIWTLLVPFQLFSSFRNRHRRWHRLAGRVTIVAAAVLAVSGILLAYSMPQRPVSERTLMTTVSLVFGFFLIKAIVAVRSRNFVAHRQWMIRMTAAGLAPMSQRILFPLFALVFGIHSINEFWDLFVSAAWIAGAINIFIAEWWLTRTAAATEQFNLPHIPQSVGA